jgi:hypothetical protein
MKKESIELIDAIKNAREIVRADKDSSVDHALILLSMSLQLAVLKRLERMSEHLYAIRKAQ